MDSVSGYECQFFYEDEVYCYKEKTGTVHYGIVIENSEYASSDEDDDSENEAPKLKRGQIRVAWYPTGKENVTSEKKVNIFSKNSFSESNSSSFFFLSCSYL